MRAASVLKACLLLAALSPIAATAQFSKPSTNEQIRIGEDVADQIRKHEKVLPPDDPRVRELRRVATVLLGTLHDNEPWHFSFDVIDKPDVNAFSLPGGPTFFFTGLLEKLKTEDELAGVLGHELTHVRMQHWATQYAANQRRDLLLNLGLIFARANRETAELVGVTDELAFSLPFSRSEESQADSGGFDMLSVAGYNPIGMAHVFKMLQDTSHGQPYEFLSDHPADAKRIQRIEDKIKAAGKTYPAERPLDF